MKSLGPLIQRAFPGPYEFLRNRIGFPAHYRRVTQAIIAKHGQRVLEGPFAGLQYISGAAGSAYIPKVLGCYELEIHPFIERIIRSNYSVLINVGCAEGYYAVGFAMRCKDTVVHAFDGSEKARALCTELAELNHVADRVRVHGFCDAKALAGLVTKDCILFCDIDTYEVELLDPSTIPELCGMDMLVELHEPLRPGMTEVIMDRFCGSHAITIVDAVERDPDENPLVQFLAPKDRPLALTESRPPGQQYAYFECRL